MTPERTEELARLWATKLGDDPDYGYGCVARIEAEGVAWWGTFEEYLDDMNTFRKAWRWMPTSDEAMVNLGPVALILRRLPFAALDNCPQALEDLAKACGMLEVRR